MFYDRLRQHFQKKTPVAASLPAFSLPEDVVKLLAEGRCNKLTSFIEWACNQPGVQAVAAARQHDPVVAPAFDAALRPHAKKLIAPRRREDDEHFVVAVVLFTGFWQVNGHIGLASFPVGGRVAHRRRPFFGDHPAEQEELPVRIPEHGAALPDGEAGVERQIGPAAGARFAETRAVMVHEKLRLVEPDRLIGACLEGSRHEIHRPAMETRVGRFVVLVMPIVIVNEERVTTAARGVPAQIIHGAG